MKRFKRMMPLVLVLLMCMARAAPASAAKIEPKPELKSEQVVKTIYGDDVVIKVIRGTKGRAPLMLPLGSITNSDAVQNALAAPKATHTFRLLDGAGTECRAHVYNDDPANNGASMEVKFSVTVNGQTSTDIEVIPPADDLIFFAYSKNGNDLVGKAVTTIQALNANSVRYTYTIQQDN